MSLGPERESLRDELLENALSFPLAERAAFIEASCGNDVELRSEIEELIKVNQRMKTEFMESVASGWLAPQFEPGQKLGRYEIIDLLGKGGMSRVYRAHDPHIDRTVALKILTTPPSEDSGENVRFLREVRVLGRISHEYIVQVYDYGEVHGLPFIVMECLKGEDLAHAITAGRTGDWRNGLGIARQIAIALDYIHRAGILHRDIKPANVFVEQSGRIKLMDFGIARTAGPRLTQIGMMVGTLDFMSPEQVLGEPVDGASDIYSFGILLFELFTGRKLYPGTGNTAQLLYKIANEPVPLEPLDDLDIPHALVNLIGRCTAKQPRERPESFSWIAEELQRIAARETCTASYPLRTKFKRGIAAGVALLLVLTVAGLLAMLSNRSGSPTYKTSVDKPAVAPPVAETRKVTVDPLPQHFQKSLAEIKASEKLPGFLERRNTAVRPQVMSGLAATPRVTAGSPPVAAPLETSAQASGVETSHGPKGSGTEPAPKSAVAEVETPGPRNRPEAVDVISELKAESRLPSRQPEPARTDPHEADRTEIQAMLQQYASAYRAREVEKMLTFWPTLTKDRRRDIKLSLDSARSLDYQLTPDSPIRFNSVNQGGTLLESAVLRCHRSVHFVPRGGSPAVGDDRLVTVYLERRNGVWRIVEMDR